MREMGCHVARFTAKPPQPLPLLRHVCTGGKHRCAPRHRSSGVPCMHWRNASMRSRTSLICCPMQAQAERVDALPDITHLVSSSHHMMSMQ